MVAEALLVDLDRRGPQDPHRLGQQSDVPEPEDAGQEFALGQVTRGAEQHDDVRVRNDPALAGLDDAGHDSLSRVVMDMCEGSYDVLIEATA